MTSASNLKHTMSMALFIATTLAHRSSLANVMTITCSNWKQPVITDTSRIIMASIHILQCGEFSLDIMYVYKHSKWLDQWKNASFKYYDVQYWTKITCLSHSVRHSISQVETISWVSTHKELFEGQCPRIQFARTKHMQSKCVHIIFISYKYVKKQ